jgi:phospholipid transport system transporter-binding protein
MVRLDGTRLYIEGPIGIETVAALVEQGAAHVRNGAEIVDLAHVTHVDSSAVALALAWLREARAAGRTIEFTNLPTAMSDLARLYAVADFIPIRRT